MDGFERGLRDVHQISPGLTINLIVYFAVYLFPTIGFEISKDQILVWVRMARERLS